MNFPCFGNLSLSDLTKRCNETYTMFLRNSNVKTVIDKFLKEDSWMIGRRQIIRLAAAYKKLPPEGRDALEQTIWKLTRIHRDFTRQSYLEKEGKKNGHRSQ
jgi:predicted nucleic-acid-binding protein